MVPLAKAADESKSERGSVQIKSFFILVAISLQVIKKRP